MATKHGNDEEQDKGHHPDFRSVLPHEPLPKDGLGYIHVQGGFEPKPHDKETAEDSKEQHYWTKTGLEKELERVLRYSKGQIAWSIPHQDSLKSVDVIEDGSSPPYTKVRICYSSPLAALLAIQSIRDQKLAPSHLFQDPSFHFTSRPLQVTLLTTAPLLSTDIAWNRSNPPKFRRLLCRPGESMEEIQKERQSTRFVFISGLVDLSSQSEKILEESWWGNPRFVSEAIRKVANTYDTTGKGVEVFVANKKKTTHFCHVGMRNPEDAKSLIIGLHGKVVTWDSEWDQLTSNGQQHTSHPKLSVQSDKLFTDYAAITKKSSAKAVARETGEPLLKGEPSRSECTSLTKDVVVPGLLLIENFLSEDEEDTLMAALNGPTAPWAPSQKTFSKSGTVKRKVQHYGYVFDYETADVLRDRSKPGADCPPMPDMPVSSSEATNEDVDFFCQNSIQEGQGWDTLACVVERTRRTGFVVPGKECGDDNKPVQRYPDINQLTVNFYEPGEGIGSHVDTPSAFSDGLISISLHGGLVMEFCKQGSDGKIKKLVYLPPRSLVLMSGPARFEWEHMIVTRMTDTVDGKVVPRVFRVSLTLRTAIDFSGNPMPLVSSREFPPVWGGDKEGSKKKDALVTPELERENVHAFYDAVATQWHHTRGKRGVLWPGATQFLTQLPPCSLVADVGCGDGKYFPAIWEAGSYVIGSDISLPLLQQAVKSAENNGSEPESRRMSEHRHHLRKRPAVAVADCMHIPLRDKSCDAAICIAVMHHLSTRERRIRCIAELGRIVKIGGLINVQAWAMEQQEGSRRKFAGTDVFVPFNAQPKYLDKVDPSSQTALQAAADDGSAPNNKSIAEVYSEEYNADFDEKKGLVVFQRYCHLYRQGEIEELVSEVDSVALHESGYETGNHFVILKVVR